MKEIIIEGYTLAFAIEKTKHNEYKRVSVVRQNRDKYMPEIYIHNELVYVESEKKKVQRLSVQIQTTTYGCLNIEEIEKMTDCYKSAIKVVEYINNYDWSEAPVIEEEEN